VNAALKTVLGPNWKSVDSDSDLEPVDPWLRPWGLGLRTWT